MIGACDHRLATFERLAQRVEHLRMELRQFVEKQHTEMSERRFAGTRSGTAADQGSHARRMMRCAEGPAPADAPAGEITGEAPDHAHFQHLGRRERRQDRGQAPRQHRLAGTGRSDHQEMMPAGRGNFERALGGLLALDVLEVGHRLVARIGRGLGSPQVCSPLKWLISTSRSDGARIGMSAAAHAASAPHEAGQIRPLSIAFAPMAAGNAPVTVAIEPSSASSPSTQ